MVHGFIKYFFVAVFWFEEKLMGEDMSLWKQLFHIVKVFGFRHAVSRIIDASRAKVNEYFRDRAHKRRVAALNERERIVVSCIGKFFELKANDFGIHRDLMADRIREPVATALMMQYVKPGYVLLDVGANIGYFSIILSDNCRFVYAVEPDKENYEALNRNVELNASKNILTFNLAFSDKSEFLYVNKSKKSNWHTTTKEECCKGVDRVEAISVDEFCEREGVKPDVIKMDIEGFERFVIFGAKKTLRSIRYLFFELHSSLLDLSETNKILDVIEESGLKVKNIIRYDRPGLWKEEDVGVVDRIRLGDYGVYEIIYARE